MFFTGSLFRFPCWLQAPFLDLHVIIRLPFLIYRLFTSSFSRFHVLQAPSVNLRVVHSLLFHLHVTDMFFIVILQPLGIKFTCYLRVSQFNCEKFTAYLQYLQEQFTSYLHDPIPLI